MILEIRRGRAAHLHRPVREPLFLVGTSPDCDMVLGDAQFASVHFYLLSRNGHTSLRRVVSAPELTVNGKELPSAILSDGDRIRTGSYEFLVRNE